MIPRFGRTCGNLLICLAVVCAVIGCSNADGSNSCGPFGNPPAENVSSVKPSCRPGKLIGPWKDSDGTDRYACIYEPHIDAGNRKLPMIVYVHPSLFSAGWVTVTNLLDFQDSVSLTPDANAPGYIVLAPEGRNTAHFYPFPDNQGIGWDNWYRQLDPHGDVKIGDTVYRENVDAATIDHFIAEQVAAGKVDPNRIYVTGWSNGAAMAILYAVNRPNIAAAAVYSAPDPFGALGDPCPQVPIVPIGSLPPNNKQVRIFNPNIPAMHIHNSCDIGGICPNGEEMAKQLRAVGVKFEDVILDGDGNRVNACDISCGSKPEGGLSFWSNPWSASVGAWHHLQWPKKSTPKMLDFFRNHPLGAAHQ
jgi:predicted esterase